MASPISSVATSRPQHPVQPSRTGEHAGRKRDPNRVAAWGVLCVVALTLPGVIALAAWADKPSPPTRMEQMASLAGVAPRVVYEGQEIYTASCASCHGVDGSGMVPLGKPLKNSGFVRAADDATLFAVIAEGRMPTHPENTTGALMPARGARNLNDDAVRSVMAYLRAIQEPGAPAASIEPWLIVPPGSGPVVAEAAGGVELAALPGRDLFVNSCSACHGADAAGVEGVGVALKGSEFVEAKSDKDLLNFIKTGRPVWDPESKTGVDMPPKGGNPALSDADLTSIIEYLRAINGSGPE